MPLASMSKATSIAALRRGRRQAGQLEIAERLVVLSEVTLALVDLDHHRRLIVIGCGEHFGALRGDRGIPLDDLGDAPPLVSMPRLNGVTSSGGSP